MTRSVILNRSCQPLASFQKPKNMESQRVHPVRGRLRPLQENAWKCAIPNDEVENLPRMDSALGVLLDGNAVKPFFFGGFYPRSRKVYGYEIRF